ncbi:zeta toxin family protein [Hymenobacter roseosalivarius]|nr:zeta toxin family protein [Hymenobacter roseosalivarius]
MKRLYIIAGCNGAGKTTAAFAMLPGLLDCHEFVNADEIARGLSPFQPEAVSVQAGRLMLTRLQDLVAAGESFALETTLATRIYLPFIKMARAKGYHVSLFFFWLDSPDSAVQRVRIRVQEGGHSIPEAVIRRRYEGGLRQFFSHYRSTVDKWVFLDNSNGIGQVIARGTSSEEVVLDSKLWQHLTITYHD